jgi:hypothetical protein
VNWQTLKEQKNIEAVFVNKRASIINPLYQEKTYKSNIIG